MSAKHWWRALLVVPAVLVLACETPSGPKYPPSDDKNPSDPPPSEGALLPAVTDTVPAG